MDLGVTAVDSGATWLTSVHPSQRCFVDRARILGQSLSAVAPWKESLLTGSC